MMKISCPEFKNREDIPSKYTCEGENISPPLKFENIPDRTASLVLIIEDPNTINKVPWIHWLVFNIPPDSEGFRENSISDGAVEGLCNGNTFGYEGPCPEITKNQYFFRLYALDIVLPLVPESDVKTVMKEMNGHIIEKAELVGMYKKTKVTI